jgi:signal transduction histidine kinase
LKWIRTISGRIVLGVVILYTTFAAVAGYGIWQMNELGQRLRFIRTGYLEVAPMVVQLQSATGQFIDYLEQVGFDTRLMAKKLEARGALLDLAARKLDELGNMPEELKTQGMIAEARRTIDELVNEHQKSLQRFDIAMGGDQQSDAARSAKNELRLSEKHTAGDLQRLYERLQGEARTFTLAVERAEKVARSIAIGLGIAATGLALAVLIWVAVTLRPLRRLRDGARRVARGDYRGRVDASGGTEIAELGREFNAMAQAIEEREQELVRSARLAAIGKMAAVITHEVRNPLSSIALNAELLEEELERGAAGPLATEAQALVRAMHGEVARLTAITEEYLRFARLPRPRLERERLGDLVGQLVEFTRGELEQRGVEIALAVDDQVPEVDVDEAQIRQALLNLVRNAGDAMPGGGRLELAISRSSSGGAEIAVKDRGKGISAVDLPRIFEPFYSTKEGGTGLGLALTHEIIREHGGRIRVESSPDGSTFVIELPAAA